MSKYESKNVYTSRRADKLYGLFARVFIGVGDRIFSINDGNYQTDPDFRTIQTNQGHFIHPDGMFTNHSCDPSAAVDASIGVLYALRNINPDEEITFDYSKTESDIQASFDCNCGAENCIGQIGTDKPA